MNSKEFSTGLAELRAVRDELKPLERELTQLQAKVAKLRERRDEKVQQLGGYAKATSDRIATAAGLSVIDIVTLVPSLAPQGAPEAPAEPPVTESVTVDQPAAQAPAEPIKETSAAPGPDRGFADQAGAIARLRAATADGAFDLEVLGEPRQAETAPAPVAAGPEQAERVLPSIPAGAEGDAWFRAEAGLTSKRPNFKQATRGMAFLDTATGVLVWQGGTMRLDLGQSSVAEILTAVYAVAPATIERIYITAGDPWHQGAERHEFLKDAVAAWLNGPLPEGWTVESSRGKDRQAGHLVHPRNPVGRWQRGDQHTEIRSVGEWFDPEGADPATVRAAFVELWKALRPHFEDVVLMGSPSQTGRDLWSRTIPTKAGAKWADGFPVMSQEIRGLLHATAGQGRTELITPPRVPERVPGWYEVDRTFAYAKHTWASGVGIPRRITAATFAAMTEKEQANALFAPSHWQVRVTIPKDWNHVGLLPAPAPGERSWHYPYEGGQTFVTWAGGAEVNLALRNPIAPWRIEILDGLLWESGDPLKSWSTKLREAWQSLRATAELHGDEQQKRACHLASRAVRSILLYGIGTFAQRPRVTTGSLELGAGGEVPDLPDGARLTGITDTHVTWERNQGFARDQYAHPEWAAGVWSAARAALLSVSTSSKDPQTGKPMKAGALHLPAGSILAFRTDAIYTSAPVDWEYGGEPGDYLLKGRMEWEQNTPRTDEEFYVLQELGRQAYESEGM
ncbi:MULTISPECIES: Mucin-19 [unclassified Streptomyces]|uniref:Mucin-19 n=1 Tax=unclassified Streptomyces TaxID=2593676 RepID=UPI001BECA85E|nr:MULTISPECIES: Mucin-19 [unclassified Streptomyces]MBT2406858.1 Mucin-19 [Streptomyces sp. ISL-21]MBT2612965.1 Mucin-19 [Streptomyces sp. ISL-87]